MLSQIDIIEYFLLFMYAEQVLNSYLGTKLNFQTTREQAIWKVFRNSPHSPAHLLCFILHLFLDSTFVSVLSHSSNLNILSRNFKFKCVIPRVMHQEIRTFLARMKTQIIFLCSD